MTGKARGRTEQVMARRHADGASKRGPDKVLVEEPMEIRLDGHRVATTMRTPGHDFELAVGFCRGEGLINAGGVTEIRYCGTGSAMETDFNVVSVANTNPSPEPPVERLGLTTAACGVCGADAIEALTSRLVPLQSGVLPADEVVRTLTSAVRAEQPLFDSTGSVHGAAAFVITDGSLVVVREDIGRHNAVDKVVGRLELDGALPATALGLFVSGRASFEMVQKAWSAGFACLIAVGGPSSLAVQTAKTARLPLIAFARGDTWTDYETGP